MNVYSSPTAFDEMKANKLLLMLEAEVEFLSRSEDIFKPVCLTDNSKTKRPTFVFTLTNILIKKSEERQRNVPFRRPTSVVHNIQSLNNLLETLY